MLLKPSLNHDFNGKYCGDNLNYANPFSTRRLTRHRASPITKHTLNFDLIAILVILYSKKITSFGQSRLSVY